MNRNSFEVRGLSPSGQLQAPVRVAFTHGPADITFKPTSPAVKNIPVSPGKPSSGYMMHLVPQIKQPVDLIPQQVQHHSSNGPRIIGSTLDQNRQFIESRGNEQRSNRSESDLFIAANSQGLSIFNRSKGFSDFNTKLQSQIKGKSFFAYQPQEKSVISPVHVVENRKINRSSSQHNIHITIQSGQSEAAPTITINPSKIQQISSPIYAQNRLVNFPPFIPRPASISQTIINHQNQSNPPLIVQQPPTIINHHHPPIIFPQQPQQNQRASFFYQNTAPAHPNTLNLESLKRQKVSSLSTGDLSRQSKVKKMSIDTAARNEYYNQPQILERDDDSQITDNRPHLNAYLRQQKLYINSRLLDVIFENETHKALLQMHELDSRSRMVSKKTSRSTKKHRSSHWHSKGHSSKGRQL